MHANVVEDPILKHIRMVTREAASADWALFPLAANAREDRSAHIIIVSAVLVAAVVALPSFDWFRSLTGIQGWIPFIRSFFGN